MFGRKRLPVHYRFVLDIVCLELGWSIFTCFFFGNGKVKCVRHKMFILFQENNMLCLLYILYCVLSKTKFLKCNLMKVSKDKFHMDTTQWLPLQYVQYFHSFSSYPHVIPDPISYNHTKECRTK